MKPFQDIYCPRFVKVNPWKRSSAASEVPSPYFEGLNIGIDVNYCSGYGSNKRKYSKPKVRKKMNAVVA